MLHVLLPPPPTRTSSRFACLLALLSLLICTEAAAQNANTFIEVLGGLRSGQFSGATYARISLGSTINYRVPLNGLRNYLFYYQNASQNQICGKTSTATCPDLILDSFLPAATGYQIEYVDGNGNHVQETSTGGGFFLGTANYAPGTDFTPPGTLPERNGTHKGANSVPAGVDALPGPLGIQGIVQRATSTGTTVPLAFAQVDLFDIVTGEIIAAVLTNGNGFYSFYYTTGINRKKEFVRGGRYQVVASFPGLKPGQSQHFLSRTGRLQLPAPSSDSAGTGRNTKPSRAENGSRPNGLRSVPE